jgi:cytosine/adenosine deaminase-related metal-dependent hydrolase
MLGVIKCAPLLQKCHHLAPAVLTARDSLAMATIEGARALRIADVVGSLEPGKDADLVRFSGAGPRLAYVHDPYQALAYCAGPGDVADVWVRGRRVVEDGVVTTADESTVVAQARTLATELFEQAGLARLLDDPTQSAAFIEGQTVS